MSATDVQHFLDNMPRTVFVFTAHPTETKSLAVIQQLGKIAGPYLARQEGWQDELSKEVATFLKTDLALDKPSAENEIKRGIDYMDEAVFNALPNSLMKMQKELRKAYNDDTLTVPSLVHCTWSGGDRDGNPNITCEKMDYAIKEQHEHVLKKYQSYANSDR